MNAHELGRLLLEGPDLPVTIPEEVGYSEVARVVRFVQRAHNGRRMVERPALVVGDGERETWPTWEEPPEPVTVYVYDGPGPQAKLLGMFEPGEDIVVDAPRVWLEPQIRSAVIPL